MRKFSIFLMALMMVMSATAANLTPIMGRGVKAGKPAQVAAFNPAARMKAVNNVSKSVSKKAAAAPAASASKSAQYAHVNLEGYNAETALYAEVGHVWATTDGGAVDVPFEDNWKVVNVATDGYSRPIVNGEVVSQDTLGIQGQQNGKDVDGGNPANTLQPFASGAALHFEATATGYLTVFFKGSSNKQYVVFEEGQAVGYEYAQLVKNTGIPEAIGYVLEGDEEGFVTEPIMKVEEMVPTAPSGWTIASKNGVAVMRFHVYEGLNYLFGATGSKMSLLGVYFSTYKDEIGVAKLDGSDAMVLLEKKPFNLTFDNTKKPRFEYNDADGDWYIEWNDISGNYTLCLDYFASKENPFGHYTYADLYQDFSILLDNSSGSRVDVPYTDADFTISDEGNDAWSLSGYVVGDNGVTYNLSGYYEKPQGETYDVELTDLNWAEYSFDEKYWYVEVFNSDYQFGLYLVSENGMFAGEYTGDNAWLYNCWINSLNGFESVAEYEIAIVSEAVVEPSVLPIAFELTGYVKTDQANTYNLHLVVTGPIEPKEVVDVNVECVDYEWPASEWPTSEYPGVAGMFIFADTDVPSRAFHVAVAQPTGEFTVEDGIVKEYTGMVDNSTLTPYMVDNGTVTVSLDMEKNILTVVAAIVCADSIQYNFTSEIPVEFDSSYTITYTANEKLSETWSTNCFGLHTNAFNVSITSHTFSNGIGAIIFSGEVTSIGDDAFYGCTGLTSITISESVTSIGYRAFCGCSSITSITIPSSVTSIGYKAFEGCSSLTSIIWNAKNYSENFIIDDYHPFYDIRSNITSFEFGENVENIPGYLCYYMSGLTSITIPESVTSCGPGAFSNCSGLTSIIWNAKNYSGEMYSFDDPFYSSRYNITSFVLGENVESIPGYLCNYMQKLTSITIPNSVKSIGGGAFENCFSLTSVHITNIAAWCGIEFAYYRANPLYYAHHLYLNDTEIKDLIIPNSVTSIGVGVFSCCTGLTSVVIPNSVTSIGSSAFYGCSSLASITIPNSVTSIGSEAFADCSSLESIHITDIAAWCNITMSDWSSNPLKLGSHLFLNGDEVTDLDIPVGVTAIKDYVFFGCISLGSVSIPSSVATIGANAFGYCSNLADIYSYATTPPAVSTEYYSESISPFYNVSKHCYIHVPEGTVRAYQMARGWSDFLHFYEISELPGGAPTDQVGVTVENNYAVFTWPVNPVASSYTLTITKNGAVFCTLIFNSFGQLVGMAFAPSRGETPAQEAESTAYGFSFVVTGLEMGSTYNYTFTSQDATNNVLDTQSGSFATLPTMMENNATRQEAIKSIVNGQLHIIRDDKTYTIQGVVVK